MKQFRPELETCPICGCVGDCHIHDYYDRSIIDFKNGKQEKSSLCVMRVFCESCQHAHAILPDFLIPYSSYSLFFILCILGEYFSKRRTVEQLCERFGVSSKQLFKWLRLWKEQKQEWLGVLSDAETSDFSFLKTLIVSPSYCDFSMAFIRQTAYTFLQSHKNPILKKPKNAQYRQDIFAPDISVV